MKPPLLLIVFFALAAPLFVQGQARLLKGQVMAENGEPVPGATLSTDSGELAISDAAGNFEIKLPPATRSLAVRCVGYFPRRFPADSLQAKFLRIRLMSNAVDLPEVAVSSRKVQDIFEEDYRTELIDYAFAGPRLLLLTRERKSYFLKLCTDDGRPLSQIQLPEAVYQLHQSCTGDYHLVGDRFVWEFTLNGTQVDTFPRYNVAAFHQLVEPCVQMLDGYYFFRKTGPFRQSVQYIYYDPDHQQHLLAVIRDKAAEDELLSRYRDILFSYMETIPDVDKDDILNGKTPLSDAMQALNPVNLTHMAETNGLVSAIGFFNQLAADSVYAPLLRLGDSLFLLDHVNNQCWEIRLEPWRDNISVLRYHKMPGWQKEVITDQPLQRLYGRFSNKSGDMILKEIDLKTGAAGKSYTLTDLPFLADHFKLRDGWLYCIGQPDVNIPNRMLYKVNLFGFGDR